MSDRQASSAAWLHHLTMVYILTKNWDALARLVKETPERSAASALPDVLDSFTDYLNHRSAWSTQAWERWRREFARFGVAGETADELIANAREALSRRGR